MRVPRTPIAVVAILCLAMAAPAAEAAKDKNKRGWTAAVGSTAPALVAGSVTLDLQLNEPAGSTVAVDSSGLGNDGAIGSHVRMNGSYADWDRHPPDARIYYGADHLIMVDDAADGSLDPGSSDFSVEFRMRSTDKFGNIMQKGQARTTGGQVKFQQPKGFVSCMYKSPTAQRSVKSTIATNDGQWHVIRCDRTSTEIRLYIDGVLNRRLSGSSGTINNNKPWTIGGKFECDPNNPDHGADSCDYFPGDIDYITFGKG